MLVPDITIYDALKGMLGEEKARQVVQGIKDQVVQEVEIQKNVLATKEDIYLLKEYIAKLDGKLTTAIEASKSEMIKWMFIFWLGAVGTLAGIMFAMLHNFSKQDYLDIAATKIWFDEERMFTLLSDGCVIGVPLAWFPRLLKAPGNLREKYELWRSGKWIHWEDLDEDLSVEATLQKSAPNIKS